MHWTVLLLDGPFTERSLDPYGACVPHWVKSMWFNGEELGSQFTPYMPVTSHESHLILVLEENSSSYLCSHYVVFLSYIFSHPCLV
jgi:hypothetical protein